MKREDGDDDKEIEKSLESKKSYFSELFVQS